MEKNKELFAPVAKPATDFYPIEMDAMMHNISMYNEEINKGVKGNRISEVIVVKSKEEFNDLFGV